MFEPSLDAWYAWLGVAVTSSVVFGIVLGIPTATPPAAGPVADAVDDVATSPYEATETVDVSAREMQLGAREVSLRTDGGASHATFAYGPVTPAGNGSLQPVLRGERPQTAFEEKSGFVRAVEQAQKRNATWQPAPEQLVVRRVQWGEFDATIVG